MSNITVTTRGLNMNSHSHHVIELLSEQISKGVKSPSDIRWVLSKEGEVIEAKCKLNSRKISFLSHGISPFLSDALHIAAKKIEKQKRRVKRKKMSRRKQSSALKTA